jgi:predicted transcriptional regulator of viral defense system
MNFTEFKEKFRGMPYVSARMVEVFERDPQAVRNQLTRWQERGLIVRLKRGIYILNEMDRKVNPSRFFMANQLLWPSYVSLESALGYYGFIPERVVDITSVSTKKTSQFTSPIGRFVYQRVKPDAFRGYRSHKDEAGLECLIAEPEKAIVDFLYLNLRKFKADPRAAFKDSYRFQNIEGLKPKKVLSWSRLFKNRRLEAVAGEFCAFIKEEKT